jgi:hypothetical protein
LRRYNLFGSAAAVILFSALVPAGHAAHSAWWDPAENALKSQIGIRPGLAIPDSVRLGKPNLITQHETQ